MNSLFWVNYSFKRTSIMTESTFLWSHLHQGLWDIKLETLYDTDSRDIYKDYLLYLHWLNIVQSAVEQRLHLDSFDWRDKRAGTLKLSDTHIVFMPHAFNQGQSVLW